MKKSPRESAIGAMMAVAHQLMKRKNNQGLTKAGFDISIDQLSIIEVLHFYGEMTLSELAMRLSKQNANITRLVDKLEIKGFIKRTAVDGDRRAFMMGITEEGKKLFMNAIRIPFEISKEIFNDISKDDQDITLRTLKNIIKKLS